MDYKLMVHLIVTVFNTFKGHLKEKVLAKLTETILPTYVIIPGYCTSKIHIKSMDVCSNKPFKTYLRGVWEK